MLCWNGTWQEMTSDRLKRPTGISSEIRTKLRDWAVWHARAGCYSQDALSSNDSKTLYFQTDLEEIPHGPTATARRLWIWPREGATGMSRNSSETGRLKIWFNSGQTRLSGFNYLVGYKSEQRNSLPHVKVHLVLPKLVFGQLTGADFFLICNTNVQTDILLERNFCGDAKR